MVKAMGRRRRGSKTGGVEPATISLGVLAAIAGVAGYGSTRGELSPSDQLKVEAAVRSRLEAERARNPRSAPCPDFKSERDALLKRLAEYESSEVRFRLATPQQIVQVIDIVKQQLGVPKKGGTQEEAVKEIEDIQSTPEPAAPVAEPASEPAAPVVDTPTEPVAEPASEPASEPVVDTPTEPVVEPVVEPTAVPPVQVEISKTPDLTQAGAILDSVPKAISRPRLITILIKLESATTQSLETLRKYFDEAFAKLEPGSKTPLKDWWKKMTTRGKPAAEPVVEPVVEPPPEPVLEPAPTVAPVVETPPEPVVTPPIESTPEPVVAPLVEPPPETVVAPPIESTPEPVVAPPPVPERKLSNIERIKGELKKDGLVNLKGGTRKKKLRTRRRDKQNVRRSSGGKNRSNRTDTYSSRRTEVDARGDELGL
jgi:hypothetical protein